VSERRTLAPVILSSMGTLFLTDMVSFAGFFSPVLRFQTLLARDHIPGFRSSMGVDNSTVAGPQDGLSNLGVVSLGGKKFQRPDHGHGFAASARRVFRTKFR
jgi:hypothetical protein